MGRFSISDDQMIHGPVSRTVLLLAAPLFVQNLVRVIQQVVDLFWVGRYSSEAVGAIGLASPVVWLLIASSISGVTVGTQVLVSQYVGADDASGARRAAFNGLLLTTVLGIAVGITVFLNVDTIIDFITTTRPDSVTDSVPDLATSYLEIIALGIVFAGLSDVIEVAFVGWGDSRASLYINVISVAGNLLLDPIFIFGAGPIPALGIQGAALATVAGYGAGFLLGILYIIEGRAGGVITLAAARIDGSEIRELADIGLPRAVQGIADNSASLLMVVIVFTAAGGPGLTAYTVGSRVGSLAMLTSGSLRNAAQTIVGQNLGADKPQRAARTTWISAGIAAGALTIIGIVQWLIPAFLALLLVPTLEGVELALSVEYLRILAIALPAGGVLSVIKGGFNASRRTKTTMVASLAQKWGLQLPLAATAGIVLGFGASGVFWGRGISIILAGVGTGTYYLLKLREGMYVEAASETTGSTSD